MRFCVNCKHPPPSLFFNFSLPKATPPPRKTHTQVVEIQKPSRVELLFRFVELVHTVWTTNSRALVPKQFLRDVLSLFPTLGGFVQHDAQEFVIFLLNHLHEQLQYSVPIFETKHNASPGKRSPLSLSLHPDTTTSTTDDTDVPMIDDKTGKPINESESSSPKEKGKEEKEEKDSSTKKEGEEEEEGRGGGKRRPKSYVSSSVISDLFGSEHISEIQCKICKHRSTTKQPHQFQVAVEIPRTDRVLYSLCLFFFVCFWQGGHIHV